MRMVVAPKCSDDISIFVDLAVPKPWRKVMQITELIL